MLAILLLTVDIFSTLRRTASESQRVSKWELTSQVMGDTRSWKKCHWISGKGFLFVLYSNSRPPTPFSHNSRTDVTNWTTSWHCLLQYLRLTIVTEAHRNELILCLPSRHYYHQLRSEAPTFACLSGAYSDAVTYSYAQKILLPRMMPKAFKKFKLSIVAQAAHMIKPAWSEKPSTAQLCMIIGPYLPRPVQNARFAPQMLSLCVLSCATLFIIPSVSNVNCQQIRGEINGLAPHSCTCSSEKHY